MFLLHNVAGHIQQARLNPQATLCSDAGIFKNLQRFIWGFKDATFDLIVTSPPYADQRNKTYGGIKPEKYVEWFVPGSITVINPVTRRTPIVQPP